MTAREGEGESILEKLDAIPQVRAFDAFPKTQPLYTTRSTKGGLFTLAVTVLLAWLTWGELSAYLYGRPSATFGVEHDLGSEMQVNLDLTVAMKCHYLTVDVRDAVGDRLHFSDTEITKDETDFEVGHAGRLDSIPMADRAIGDLVDAARHLHVPTFSRKSKPKRKAKGYGGKQVAFAPTEHIVKDGNACRIYGSVLLKKVTGNLHISTLGHGYFSFEHTPHEIMNLSHVIHEFSFGPYFPDIAQPLDHSVELSNDHFAVFQYFVNIVPTKYVDSSGRTIKTNQYSVTDYARTVTHGLGVPGIFIKFDVEPLVLTLRQRTSSLMQFLVRLAGIVGGVWVCAGYTLRAGDRAVKTAFKAYKGADWEEDQYPQAFTAAYSSSRATRAPAWSAGHDDIYNSGPRSPSSSPWYTNIGGDGAGGQAPRAVSGALSAAKDKAGQAWQAAADLSYSSFGPKHRKTESLATKILSEEGRGTL
ncbi:unnamed protein product [Parajaminaea phylloscopi]